MTHTRDPEIVEVFECEGSFSFLREPHRFCFRVHTDSSLCVDIEPLVQQCASGVSPGDDGAANEASTAATTGGNARDAEDVDAGDAVAAEGQADATVDAQTGVPEAEEAPEPEETETKVLAYDGRALIELQTQESNVRDQDTAEASTPACYVLHFKLVQWGRGAQGMWSEISKCIARVTPELGASGRFVELRQDAEAQDFSLKPVAHRLERLTTPLHPLTPGEYEFQGVTIAENALVYECVMRVTLQNNGMASGTSRELPFAQECPLAGAWSRDDLNFLLQYEMHGNKHTYIYFGTPYRSGLRGTWQNSELRALGTNADVRTSSAERGCLELRLVSATRVWSERFHKDYPEVFRECVKLLLLAALRSDGNGQSDSLPSHLWSYIVSFCSYDWFSSEAVRRLQASEPEAEPGAVLVP